jgi:DNA-binding CsgD family transcriptional regulator
VARRASPATRSIHHFQVAGRQYVRVAFPLLPRLPATLTAAESEVAALIIAGRSNAQIAKARGVALRTVANQVASILRKMRVGSRSALLAKLTHGDD